MAKLKRFLRKWWWAIASATVFVLYVVFDAITRDKYTEPRSKPPKFLEKARTEVERVRLEGEIEKAKVSATAEAHREQLRTIEEMADEDPVQARKELSDWLTRSL